MRSFKLFIMLLAVFGYVCFGNSNQTSAESDEVNLIVKYKDKVTSQSNQKTFPIDIIPADSKQLEEKVKELEKDPEIDYIEMDAKVYAQGTPNDPLYIEQEDEFKTMNIEKAWSDYDNNRNDEVVVAVIDSGVNMNHPDLKGQLVAGENLLNGKLSPKDTYGHGTHVAGLIGAKTNNKLGISSLSLGDVKIMPIKMMEENEGKISDVIDGIEYAVDHGADVINLSLGTYVYRSSLKEAVDYAVDQGVLVVAAAGNDDREETLYPAAFDKALSVGSYDIDQQDKASFSNFGSETDVVTPGTDIVSTYLQEDYEIMGGTSMSTGHVSSLAALLKSQAPFLTGQQTKRLIEGSARTVPSHVELGKGMVDAEHTLKNIEDSHRLAGPTSVETSVEISQKGWKSLKEKSIEIEGKTINGKFAILATGNEFPDSLAASPLASYLDSPVLLEKKSRLSAPLKKELKRLGVTDVIMVGGPGALSKGVKEDLDSEGYKTHRVNGTNRYETAIAINRLIPYETNKAFIVSGQEYADALSAAGYSGMKQYPILYVQPSTIPDVVKEYMKDQGITKTYIVGGETPVSKEVENKLPDSNPFRIAGKNRYLTNLEMHKTFGNDEAASMYFATGQDYPDGLAAAPLAVKTSSPIILTFDNQMPTTNESIHLFNERRSYNILGGPAPVKIPLAWEIDHSFYN